MKKAGGSGLKSENEYDGLADRHLKHFFLRRATQNDLMKNGLIDEEKNMVPKFQIKRLSYAAKGPGA